MDRCVSLGLAAGVLDASSTDRTLDVVAQAVEARELLLARQHRVVRVGGDLFIHRPSRVGDARCALAALGSGVPDPNRRIGHLKEVAPLHRPDSSLRSSEWDSKTDTS